jgi:Type IV pilin-like G and H, putative
MIYLATLSPSTLARLSTLFVLGAVSTLVVQSAKAEPKSSELPFLEVILRAQQSYRFEHKTFASSVSQLDIRSSDLRDYRYTILKSDTKQMIAKSIPIKPGRKSYAAGGFLVQKDDFTQILCESDGFSQSIVSPYLQKGVWNCGRYSHVILRAP